jgi:glyoxylase-like metal-dependent hydrolase (beta-lactamase superfamily II)
MTTELIDGVYDITYLEGPGRRYRVYLFEGPVPTLIDAGYEETTDELIDGIDETGIAPERMIITHGDGDHIGGFDDIVSAYEVETWVPEATDAADIDPNHRYGHGDEIGRFEAIYIPGHSADHHALVDEDAGVLVSGDAMIGADMRGLPEGFLLAPPKVYSENVDEAEQNLETLLEYEWETALVSHGTSVISDAYEKLDYYMNFPRSPLQ